MSKLSNKTIVIITFTLIILGLLLISNDYLKSKKEKAYEKIRISLMTTEDNTPKSVEKEETKEEPTPEPEKVENEYLGVLEIDKINLSQGFYDKDNKDNNVSKNVTFLEPAHSGTSHIAYFKHLYQLNVGDRARVIYKGKTYTYKIENIYYEEKDGEVTIYRDTNKSTLTMITCTKNDDTKQTIYIAYLESVR